MTTPLRRLTFREILAAADPRQALADGLSPYLRTYLCRPLCVTPDGLITYSKNLDNLHHVEIRVRIQDGAVSARVVTFFADAAVARDAWGDELDERTADFSDADCVGDLLAAITEHADEHKKAARKAISVQDIGRAYLNGTLVKMFTVWKLDGDTYVRQGQFTAPARTPDSRLYAAARARGCP